MKNFLVSCFWIYIVRSFEFFSILEINFHWKLNLYGLFKIICFMKVLTGHCYLVVNRQYTNHCETHRVHDQDGRVACQDAPERLRQWGRCQHGDPHHAGELHQHPEVQRHTVNEEGMHDSPGLWVLIYLKFRSYEWIVNKIIWYVHEHCNRKDELRVCVMHKIVLNEKNENAYCLHV